MSDRKIVPIGGKHKSLSSLAAEVMATEKWVRGFIISFEEDGTMHCGEFKIQAQDVGMALMYLNMLGTEMMK